MHEFHWSQTPCFGHGACNLGWMVKITKKVLKCGELNLWLFSQHQACSLVLFSPIHILHGREYDPNRSDIPVFFWKAKNQLLRRMNRNEESYSHAIAGVRCTEIFCRSCLPRVRRLCYVYVQITGCSPVQLQAGMHKQATDENRDNRRSWNPKIRWSWLDTIQSTNRNISECFI